MRKLPLKLPSVYRFNSGVPSVPPDVNTGGYDLLVGGFGFRFATSTDFPYSRATEPTTVQKFDSSLEPGEQSLSPLPWIKSQASFHAGAGQLNLEQGFTAFQYQQEQVEHIRFDGSLGVNVWTPGQVSRLPDTTFTSYGFDSSCVVTAAVGGVDYAIIGGVGSLRQLKWTSGPDSAPTVNSIDLSSAVYGGASNVKVAGLATDGANYYALLYLTTFGSLSGVSTYVVRGSITSTTGPVAIYNCGLAQGAIGWVKARLMAGLGQSVYELDPPGGSLPAALPAPNYTHPALTWSWATFGESPAAVLAAGSAGNQSSVLSFELDDTGAVPVLSGGATVAVLPPGELVYAMGTMLGSFLALGTTEGIRIGTFDTYTGALSYGPLTVSTTEPVLSMTGRDRFVYGSYTNQQEDGRTGLVAVDLSMVVDAAGRNAYAPDLRPPSTAPTGQGAVTAVSLLPLSRRLIFVTPEGIHVEGDGPGADGVSYLRTSRIRYDTAEQKVFKFGRINGNLDAATIQVIGMTPFQSDQNLGTFGFIGGNDPGEFGLPRGLNEWIQLRFILSADAVFNSYQVRAYPAPKRQRIIQFTVNCLSTESNKSGNVVHDPQSPRARLQNVLDLESIGDEVRFVEFTNLGPVAQTVLIDQIVYQQFSPPALSGDFGGYITFKLRADD